MLVLKKKQGTKKCKWFELVMKKQLVKFQKASHDIGKKHTNIDTEILKVKDREQYVSKFLKRKLVMYNYQTN